MASLLALFERFAKCSVIAQHVTDCCCQRGRVAGWDDPTKAPNLFLHRPHIGGHDGPSNEQRFRNHARQGFARAWQDEEMRSRIELSQLNRRPGSEEVHTR